MSAKLVLKPGIKSKNEINELRLGPSIDHTVLGNIRKVFFGRYSVRKQGRLVGYGYSNGIVQKIVSDGYLTQTQADATIGVTPLVMVLGGYCLYKFAKMWSSNEKEKRY